MTREEAKEHFWKDTEKFGESVSKKFGSINYQKIFTGYYIGSEIDKFIDKIYDHFEDRNCENCKHWNPSKFDLNEGNGEAYIDCNVMYVEPSEDINISNFYCNRWERKRYL